MENLLKQHILYHICTLKMVSFVLPSRNLPVSRNGTVIVGDELGGILKQHWPIEGTVHYFPQSTWVSP
jgi:hypothetical protein